MQKTENKTTNSVRSKLVAAIAMLLVATIMVVSSTYAWFTLSTKPEVTGISTAVGANGALEIALARYNGTTFEQLSGELDENTSEADRNLYWGNLVNLGLAEYGSNKIVLYPSKLYTDTNGIVLGTPIQTPVYGADGRVESLLTGGMFGKYDDGSFIEDKNYYGFRALGVASGLTERQQAFRAALAQISVHQSIAQSTARNSLSANGEKLAGLAIKHAMGGGNDTYKSEDTAGISAMITDLEAALAEIENAYLETIYATINGKSSGLLDDEAKLAAAAAKTAADGATGLGAKVTAAIGAISQYAGGSITTSSLTDYGTFTSAVSSVATAKTELAKITKTEGITWAELSAALRPLVNLDTILVNDIPANEINSTEEDNKGKIVSDVAGGKGITVSMATGGGVFADIADYTGDYTVAIKIDTTPLNTGIDVKIDATMKTKTSKNPPIFNAIKNVVGANNNYPDGGSTTKPITEFYGYVMDLAFKTNASTSNLLLKTTPADRIYSDNQNEATMGKGSTMTFGTTDPTFTKADMLNLASNINIVFYDTTTGKIYATAKLDTAEDKVTATADGYQANIHIVGENSALITEEKDAKITALNPNEAKYISALVYLDGENITNADVSAIAQSLTGTLNLQFASSAELVPMDYSDLHQKAPAANNP